MKNFVIITPGRSGSTFLAQTLNEHQEIFCEEEVFNRSETYEGSFNHFLRTNPMRKTIGFFFNREKLSTSKLNLPLRGLLILFLRTKRKENNITGFKLSLDQLFAYPQLFSILKNSYRVLYLTRQDKLRIVLSLLASRKTGLYDTFDGQKIELDPVLVKSMILEIQDQERKCRAFFSKRLEIGSQDLFYNTSSCFQRITEYLALATPMDVRISKQVRPDNLSDWVENIDEIEMYLKRSAY